MSEWHYGEIGTASAEVADGRLIVRVDGMRPAPCFEVKLAEYARDPHGTVDVQLGLYWRPRAEPFVVAPVPYAVRAEVDVRGIRAPTVRIDHASGYVDVRVRHAPSGAHIRITRPPG